MMSGMISPDSMVKGMIMGGHFLRKLQDKILELGGHPEMIHFLTTDRAEETLTEIAKVVVGSPWRIPRSLIQKVLRENLERLVGDDNPNDMYHWWGLVLNHEDFGLYAPELFFDHNYDRGIGADPAPQEVIDQLRGKIRPADVIIVTLNGEEYIVTQLGLEREREIGEPLFTHDGELLYVDLAPLRCFDLSR